MSKTFALIAVVTIAATGWGIVAASAPPPTAAAGSMVVYKSPT